MLENQFLNDSLMESRDINVNSLSTSLGREHT